MSLHTKDVVRYSAYCISCIAALVEKSQQYEDIVRGVRTRSRQLYEVLVYQGLPYFLAYIGGKASERKLRELYEVFFKNLDTFSQPIAVASELADKIKNMSREDASYGLYGASFLSILSKVMNKKFDISIEKLIEEYGFNKVVYRLSYEIVKWLKFFAEAKLEE